jgi:hypothetical protein
MQRTLLARPVARRSAGCRCREADRRTLARTRRDGRSASRVTGAFEVEHATSIYAGIVRMLDMALGAQDTAVTHLFLVAPDDREEEVRAQLLRPAFSRVSD